MDLHAPQRRRGGARPRPRPRAHRAETTKGLPTALSDIGGVLKGRTIDTVLVGDDRRGATGDFTAYIDDIEISNG